MLRVFRPFTRLSIVSSFGYCS